MLAIVVDVALQKGGGAESQIEMNASNSPRVGTVGKEAVELAPVEEVTRVPIVFEMSEGECPYLVAKGFDE